MFKYFKKTKLPGSLLNQKFCGRLDENVFWPNCIPKIEGFMENELEICLLNISIFFLFRKKETIVDNLLSHKVGYLCGIELYFFFKPFEKTVIRPKLFLPALFFKKTLKNLFGLENFIKKVDFLNLCEGVTGLCIFVKI